MRKFKVGDRVKVTKDMLNHYVNCPVSLGDEGIVRFIDYNTIGVEFDKRHSLMNDLDGCCKNFHGWWCYETEIELAIPTFSKIKEKKIDCLIRTRTQRDADELFIKLKTNSSWLDTPDKCWAIYRHDTTYHIEDGKIRAYSDINWYKTNPPYSELPVYEFEDIVRDGGIIKDWTIVQPFSDDFIPKLKEYYKEYYAKPFNFKTPIKAKKINNKKENDNMNKDAINFTFTKGERTAIVVDTIEHKDSKNKTILEKKTREVKIPTITTTAKTINGTGSTTCDEEDFNERTGCLVASAKIIASKSEEANLMYQIAIKSWGEAICTTILETLAGRAIAGDFNKRYDKWKKIATEHDKELRTCKMCGKLYESTEEARECEQAHRQRKVDKLNKYRDRKETMRMARERLEKERKEQLIKDAMDELASEDKKNK